MAKQEILFTLQIIVTLACLATTGRMAKNSLLKMNSPWEIMRPKLKELGYSDEQIDDMTLAELFELCED